MFGSRSPAVALLMRTGRQKGTAPYLGYLLTWAELFGGPILVPPLTSWASHFTSLGSVFSLVGLVNGHKSLVDHRCPVKEIVPVIMLSFPLY